ncbi:FAD-dependent oxidoreductase [Arthrobacter sp. CG_A4]|uniref:FAD-dependent oxidoreductase n=1 Tax=Arthrobacter sp. CG_A4 TaxID=3071706 RepID=UPI002E108FD6
MALTGCEHRVAAWAGARCRTYWYASYRSELGPSGIDVAVALEATRERYSGEFAGLGRVLMAATPGGTLVQRIWTAPLLARYARDGVVLVGDAAHAMTPNLGRGAGEALIDAAARTMTRIEAGPHHSGSFSASITVPTPRTIDAPNK